MPHVRDDFTIKPSFRLWMSTRANFKIPINYLQSCNKIVLEPVKGIKHNAIK